MSKQIEVRVHEDTFHMLGNEVLCAMHVLNALRDRGVPVVGNIALVGVRSGTLDVFMGDDSLDGDEYVYRYNPDGVPVPGVKIWRYHEDLMFPGGTAFGFNSFVESMVTQGLSLRSQASPHMVSRGVLTLYTEETLDGDQYVFMWSPSGATDNNEDDEL